jgi:Na+/proline symporter
MYGITFADVCVIVAYLLGVTALGVWAGRRIKGMDEFAMPRAFGKVMMIFFSFGTGTNTDHVVTVSAKSFSNGIAGIWYSWMNIFTTPFFWIIATAFRRLRAITTGDVFAARFGRPMSLLYAFLGFTKLTFSIGVTLKGGAVMLTALSDGAIPGDAAILVLTCLFVFYGVAGGLSAAIVTDFAQGILTLVFSFMLLPFVLKAAGGLAGAKATLADPEKFNLFASGEITWFFVTMLAVVSLLNVLGAPHTMGNCAAGRDENDGAVGFMAGSFLKRICTVAWSLVGLAAAAHFVGREIHPEAIYGAVAREFLPQVGFGLLGLFVASFMAGMMSTCDALMVSASSLFTQNLYRPVFPGRVQGHYLKVVRAASVTIVVGAVSIAYLLPGFIAGVEMYWKLSSVIGLPLLLGLVWRGITPAGAWAATLGAYAAWLVTTLPWVVKTVAAWPVAAAWGIVNDARAGAIALPWQILFYVVTGIVAGVVTSRFTRPLDAAKLDLFYALMRTPIQRGEVVTTACTLPEGVVPPPARHLFPGTGIELLVPTRRTIAGFLSGCAGVAGLIGFVIWLMR